MRSDDRCGSGSKRWVDGLDDRSGAPDSQSVADTVAKTGCLWGDGLAQAALRAPLASRVPSVAFSPDGATLAVVAYEQLVKLLDVRTGATRATFKGH
jgi:hypothetical protein